MSDAAARLLDADLVKRVRHLTLLARTVAEGVYSGRHRSPRHGASIEFSEHKEYSPGDDLRRLDWKVLGRLDRYVIRKFEQETNLKTFMIVDASASMGYGEGSACKLLRAQTLAAALLLILLRQQDPAGFAPFTEGLDGYIPPRASARHFNDLVESLARLTPRGKTDLSRAIFETAGRVQSRSLVFLFTDFLHPDPDTMRLMARMKARQNDVALFHILHRDEIDLPFDHLIEFEEMEGPETALADPDAIREEYRRVVRSWSEEIRRECQGNGIAYQLAPTDEPAHLTLVNFLAGRERAAGR